MPLKLADGTPNPVIVAYVADNPNARYVTAQLGAFANAGRNTLQLPGIRNLDFSIFKNFKVRETKSLQFRVDLYNAFNHAQYVPGSIDSVVPVANTGALVTDMLLAGSSIFNQPGTAFSNNPRVIQLQLRFTF